MEFSHHCRGSNLILRSILISIPIRLTMKRESEKLSVPLNIQVSPAEKVLHQLTVGAKLTAHFARLGKTVHTSKEAQTICIYLAQVF